MKKTLSLLSLLSTLLLFSYSVVAQEPVSKLIDASDPTEKKFELDFTKGFNFIFNKNMTSSNTEVKLEVKGENISTVLMKGISASSIIAFTAKDRTLEVADSKAKTVSISEGPIIISYGAKKIIITNSGGTAENPPSSPKEGSGIEIHDALLATKYFEERNPKLHTLLRNLKRPMPAPNVDSLKKAYKDNPFIKSLLEGFNPDAITETKTIVQGGEQTAIGSFITKVGQTDVTSLADGISRFLVKRTKEELNIAFFQHFKDLINKEKYKDLQILFPNTMIVLNSIDQDIYLFENYITSLREAFEKDLSLLLDDLPVVVEEGRFKDYFNSKPDLKYSLLLSLFSAKELVNGTHPGKVIEILPPQYVDQLKDQNAKAAIQTLQLVSASLRARGGDRYWTSIDSVRRLFDRNDPNLIVAKFYLGLLFEKGGTIKFSGNKTLQSYLTDVAKNIDNIKAYILFVNTLADKCNTLEAAIAQVKDKKESAPIDVYHRLFGAFGDVVEQLNEVGNLPGINVDGKITTAVTHDLKIFRQANDLALNVAQKNYSSAVINAYTIYLVIVEIKKKPEADSVFTNKALFTENVKKDNATSNTEAKETADLIKKYGNFMANVVKAKSSQEVAEAIEAIALPVGSSTIKKHSNFSISLNAYVGLYLGAEKIDGIDKNYNVNAYGVTAPIGLAFNFGCHTTAQNAQSFSLFFSFIDLGAPVAFRFKDNKTEAIPSVSLKDIISPGAFISYGLPGVPLSINAGWQMGPILRDINPDYASLAESNYSRFSLSLLVDIPILNFYKSVK